MTCSQNGKVLSKFSFFRGLETAGFFLVLTAFFLFTRPVRAAGPVCSRLMVGPSSGVRNLLVMASVAGASQNQDGLVAEYRLNWGDGSEDENQVEPVFSHLYRDVGEFEVKAWVKDELGSWAGGEENCRAVVTVGDVQKEDNLRPECQHLSPSTVSGLKPLTVKFEIEAVDPDGTLNHYWVDFGDGYFAQQDSASFQHVYQTEGAFFAQARVRDNNQQWSGLTVNCKEEISVGAGLGVGEKPTATPVPGKPLAVGGGGEASPSAAPETGWSIGWLWFLGMIGFGLTLIFRPAEDQAF
ncbi:MAG: PKD domain-containing protein [Candidatus Pacebacteria bacterium]|nr:PKD domain-containing protein [Candidatus Paceibacterota bacterium]